MEVTCKKWVIRFEDGRYMKRTSISSLMEYTNKIEHARFFDRESSANLSSGVSYGGEIKEVQLTIKFDE